MHDDVIENRTFDEIDIGDSATLRRRLTLRDIKLFAVMSGDVNPAHVDEDYAKSSRFHEVIAHGLWGGALISTLLGTQLPGPGTIYLSQSLQFRRPLSLGDLVIVTVTVTEKEPGRHRVVFDCLCTNQEGATVIDGTAEVLAPTEKVRRPRWVPPAVHLHERVHLHRLLDAARSQQSVRAAVVHPVDADAVTGVAAAAKAGLIAPVLIGPEHKIHAAAVASDIDLAAYRIVGTEHSHAAAARAVALAVREMSTRSCAAASPRMSSWMPCWTRGGDCARNGAPAMCSPSTCRPTRNRCSSPTRRSTPTRPSKTSVTSCRMPSTSPMPSASDNHAWRCSRPSKPWRPASGQPCTRPRCARWPTEGRSTVVWSTDHGRSTPRTTPSAGWRHAQLDVMVVQHRRAGLGIAGPSA